MRLPPLVQAALIEARDGSRALVPLLAFAGMLLYMLANLTSAETFAQMGGAGIPRNSGFIVYIWCSGQALWLMFVWAWLFAQIILRDKTSGMQQLVLASPFPLHSLMVGRFLGALMLGTAVACAIPLAFLCLPVLGAVGLVPESAVGPTPWRALLTSIVLFGVASSAAVGGLCAAATLWTRSLAGPFGVAAVLVLLWVSAIVSLSEGGAAPLAAVLFDPSGYVSVDNQAKLWTPAEKILAPLELGGGLLVNRLVWLLLGLGLFAILLHRTSRDALLKEPGPQKDSPVIPSVIIPATQDPAAPTDWLVAARLEMVWHLQRTLRGAGLWVLAGFTYLICAAYPAIHSGAHRDGPLLPFTEQIVWVVFEGGFMTLMAAAAFLAGFFFRRDGQGGYSEMIDSAQAPLPVRLVGQIAALVIVLAGLSLVPGISLLSLQILAPEVPASPLDALGFSVVVMLPAMVEMACAALVLHVVIRSSGIAYALSLFLVFFVIASHEAQLIHHPLASFGLPPHVLLSELTGWGPWAPVIATVTAYKLALCAMMIALAWAAWPRGTDRGLRTRLKMLAQQARPGPAFAVILTLPILLAAAGKLEDRQIRMGAHQSSADAKEDAAGYEARWWQTAGAFALTGGDVAIALNAAKRTGHAVVTLDDVRSDNRRIDLGLPHGMSLVAAEVDGTPASYETAYSHGTVALGSCPDHGCHVTLRLRIDRRDWPEDLLQSWIDRSGLWLRAEDAVPVLGVDPSRLLRAPSDRVSYGLPSKPRAVPVQALRAAGAVAPAGTWTWSVTLHTGDGTRVFQGRTEGPLDFATVWSRGLNSDSDRLHGPSRAPQARRIAADAEEMTACIAAHLGTAPPIHHIIQAPRNMGPTALHGAVLWLPENEGWDSAGRDPGRAAQRHRIAQAIARTALSTMGDLREEPGMQVIRDGISGWLALECLRQTHGPDPWAELLARQAEDITEAFGQTDAPIVSAAQAMGAPWLSAYAPLAILGLEVQIGRDAIRDGLDQLLPRLRQGQPLDLALNASLGAQQARALLGPPAMGDVAFGSAVQQARFWGWQDGGWRAVHPLPVLKMREGDAPDWETRDEKTTDPDGFVHFARPSYERSPQDNSPGPERYTPSDF